MITPPIRPATLFFCRPSIPQDFPSLHHKDHSLHGMDIFRGISRHGNDVRGFPLFKRTDSLDNPSNSAACVVAVCSFGWR